MPPAPQFGPADDAQLDAYGRLASEAFGVPLDRMPVYFNMVGRDTARVIRVGDEVAGGLVAMPKGQFFGGRSVSMAGIALVVTAAHRRGGGLATLLLREMLREQRAAGMALSTLYPATVKLYRRSGYEIAGLACEVHLHADKIDVRSRELSVRPFRDEDEPAVRAVYRAWAIQHPGALDRTEFHWQRVRNFRGEATRGYVVTRGDTIEGYAFIRDLTTGSSWSANLYVQDMAYVSHLAGRTLLNLLSDQRTTRHEIVFRSGPSDPLLLQLGEIPYTLTHKLPWMVRIVDVPRALASRGYAAGLNASLTLEVVDDFLPEVGGTFELQVRDGNAECARVTQLSPPRFPLISIDVRTLAAIYTGYLNAADAALTAVPGGDATKAALRGDARAIDVAAGLFSGAMPWMRDEF